MVEITLEMAEGAGKAALAKAKEIGVAMSVSVVDDGGRLVYCARGDGTGFFTPEISKGKAVASAAFRFPTKNIGEGYSANPAFWGSAPTVLGGQILPAAGAVPIMRQGHIIGAIGCSGGTGEQDHQCAEAGAATITG